MVSVKISYGISARPKLSKDSLAEARKRYVKQFRRGPDPEERPSNDQLSALRTKICTGEPPCVDFAIFGPHGKRLQKAKRQKAMIWCDGHFVTRNLEGPVSVDDWVRSWRVFRTAMIMLEGASVGTLDAYEKGVVGLAAMYPTCWGIISVADDLCRQEKWELIKDEFDMEQPRGYDPQWPWDHVILESAWGNPKSVLAHWWRTRVEHPASLPQDKAHNFLAKAEGVPLQMIPHRQADRDAERWVSRLTEKEKTPRLPKATLAALPDKPPPTKGKGECWAFLKGQCTAEGQLCPQGRSHGSPSGGRPPKGEGKRGKAAKAAAAAAAAAKAQPKGKGQQAPDPNSKRSQRKAALAAGKAAPGKKARHV